MSLKRFNEMASGRESVRMRDICTSERLENGLENGWDILEDEEFGFDAEKGFIDHKCILQRQSDKKFFKVEYTQYGFNGTDLLDQTADEVYRRAVTTYEYY